MCSSTVLAEFVVWQLGGQLGRIFYFIVLPMLLLAGIGYVNQRRLKLDLRTLTKLNFDFVVPAVVYVSVVTADVRLDDVLKVVYFGLAMLAGMAAVTYVVARVRRVPAGLHGAMLMTTMFNNSGNYGMPLQSLAFEAQGLSAAALSLQTFYMVVQNFINFTIGVLLAASGRKDRHWRENLLQVVRFPPIYALAAAILTVEIRSWYGLTAVPELAVPFWKVADYVRNAFVAVALFTLGAQLAAVGRGASDYPVKTSVVLRLLIGPAVGLALIYLTGVRGMLAQVLLISTTTPTAVNTMLLCLEFDNHPGFAARAVLYSTVLSPLTVTGVIFLAQGNFLDRLQMPAATRPESTAMRQGEPPETSAGSATFVGLTVEEGAGDTETFRKVLDPIVQAINAGDYEAARKDFNKEMAEALPPDEADEAFSFIRTRYGTITNLGRGKRLPHNGAIFPAESTSGTRLNVTIYLDKEGKIAGLWFLPATPEIPVPDRNLTKLRLPFRGACKVFWGGDTAEQNAHHDVPNQRYGFDFLIVGPDGATHRGDGKGNEDY